MTDLRRRLPTNALRALRPTELRRWRSGRENRERFLQIARDFAPYLVAEREGRLLILATDDPTHARLFSREKQKEQKILPKALEYLERSGVAVPRRTFIDVGANVGTTTFAALEAGFSSVIAFEPMASSFRILRANLVLNDLEDSVVPLQLALSNRSGRATLDVESGSRKARVLTRSSDLPSGHSQEILLARLDDLVAEGTVDPSQVSLVFIDAEGHECHVLEGATCLLRAEIPLIMELNPKLLRLAGKIDALTDLLGRHYTHVLDLRVKSGAAFVSVDQLGAMIEGLKAGGATDIIACRLPAA